MVFLSSLASIPLMIKEAMPSSFNITRLLNEVLWHNVPQKSVALFQEHILKNFWPSSSHESASQQLIPQCCGTIGEPHHDGLVVGTKQPLYYAITSLWIYLMCYDHLSARPLLANLGRQWWWMMRLAWKKSQKTLDIYKYITSKWDPKHRECGQTKHNWLDSNIMPNIVGCC